VASYQSLEEEYDCGFHFCPGCIGLWFFWYKVIISCSDVLEMILQESGTVNLVSIYVSRSR